MPLSWLTLAALTSGRASRAFLTLASQCPHIMPSIFMVFSIVVTSSECLECLDFKGLSFLASRRLNRFSRRALETTQKLERLMAAAPNMGFSVSPKGMKSPAARGMPMVL